MPLSLEGWSPLGIASAAAIVPGVVLLVVYAVRRGLVDRELDALDPEEPLDPPEGEPLRTDRSAGHAGRRAAPRDGSRAMGTVGALLLAVGLAMGVLTAIAGWGGGGTATGPGLGPDDCAQSWGGCPQATLRP
jgi:hypothetical protein